MVNNTSPSSPRARARRLWVDRSAVGLSALCLLHCLAGAIILSLLSISGSYLMTHEIHAIGLLLAMPLAVVGLWRGYLSHRRWRAPLIGGAGLAFMALALAAAHGQLAEMSLTMVGVFLLGAAHMLNMRWVRALAASPPACGTCRGAP